MSSRYRDVEMSRYEISLSLSTGGMNVRIVGCGLASSGLGIRNTQGFSLGDLGRGRDGEFPMLMFFFFFFLTFVYMQLVARGVGCLWCSFMSCHIVSCRVVSCHISHITHHTSHITSKYQPNLSPLLAPIEERERGDMMSRMRWGSRRAASLRPYLRSDISRCWNSMGRIACLPACLPACCWFQEICSRPCLPRTSSCIGFGAVVRTFHTVL